MNYQSATGHFPPGRKYPDLVEKDTGMPVLNPGTSYSGQDPSTVQLNYQSVHVRILSYIDNAPFADQIKALGSYRSDLQDPAAREVFSNVEGFFVCPSDSNTGPTPFTENNYRVNFGGSTAYAGAVSPTNPIMQTLPARGIDARGNGAFDYSREGLKPKAFTDGLSKTVFWGERLKGSLIEGGVKGIDLAAFRTSSSSQAGVTGSLYNECKNVSNLDNRSAVADLGRWIPGGGNHSGWGEYSNGWPFGTYLATLYNHVAPPNWQHWDCANNIPDTPGEAAVIAARSEHPGVVNVAFGDGHADAISDSIDEEVWRAMGSRDGGAERDLLE
jgi:prepilin-type processing-associated H-X9-DG protein